MARRTRRSKFSDLITLILLSSLSYLVYGPVLATGTWILLAIAVLLLWISFVIPTYCDYRTQRGKACSRGVNGKLRGCHDHGRDKRDAVWRALFGVRNPGEFVRVMWHSPDDARPRSTPGTTQLYRPVTTQGTRDATILVCTVVSTVSGVIGVVISVIGLWQ
jgi:hypothetical protein